MQRLAVRLLLVDDAAAAAVVLDVARRPADGVAQLLNLERVLELGQDLLVRHVQLCASTLSRPRCAMPIKMLVVPASADDTINSSSIGTSMSSPSIEKRYLLGKTRCRNCSKTSTWVSRSSRLLR